MVKEMLGRVFDLEALKKAWKYYSTYAFLLIAGLPELVPQIVAALPEALGGLVGGTSVTRYMQIAALGGLVLRYVKQGAADAKAKALAEMEKDESDEAGA